MNQQINHILRFEYHQIYIFFLLLSLILCLCQIEQVIPYQQKSRSETLEILESLLQLSSVFDQAHLPDRKWLNQCVIFIKRSNALDLFAPPETYPQSNISYEELEYQKFLILKKLDTSMLRKIQKRIFKATAQQKELIQKYKFSKQIKKLQRKISNQGKQQKLLEEKLDQKSKCQQANSNKRNKFYKKKYDSQDSGSSSKEEQFWKQMKER